jgi:hypothetical protein
MFAPLRGNLRKGLAPLKPGTIGCIKLVVPHPLRLLPAGAKVAGWASQPTEKLRLSTAHWKIRLVPVSRNLRQARNFA